MSPCRRETNALPTQASNPCTISTVVFIPDRRIKAVFVGDIIYPFPIPRSRSCLGWVSFLYQVRHVFLISPQDRYNTIIHHYTAVHASRKYVAEDTTPPGLQQYSIDRCSKLGCSTPRGCQHQTEGFRKTPSTRWSQRRPIALVGTTTADALLYSAAVPLYCCTRLSPCCCEKISKLGNRSSR